MPSYQSFRSAFQHGDAEAAAGADGVDTTRASAHARRSGPIRCFNWKGGDRSGAVGARMLTSLSEARVGAVQTL